MLPQISRIAPLELKNNELVELFKMFAADTSKWVKLASFQYLGEFIASFQDGEISPVLIEYFMQMSDPSKNSSNDSDLAFHCAYNFPAVLLTLGKSHWP